MKKKTQSVKKDVVRAEVRNLVHGPSYMTFEDAVADFPMKHINTRPPNIAYSPWHLLEHMRLAQQDILDYIRKPDYRAPKWPDDYWPRVEVEADAKAWKKTGPCACGTYTSRPDAVSSDWCFTSATTATT